MERDNSTLGRNFVNSNHLQRVLQIKQDLLKTRHSLEALYRSFSNLQIPYVHIQKAETEFHQSLYSEVPSYLQTLPDDLKKRVFRYTVRCIYFLFTFSH